MGRDLEAHYAVPPHWPIQQLVDPELDRLQIKGTSFIEPDCRDEWCNSVNSVKWKGPAKEGIVITTGFETAEAESMQHDEL